MNVIKYLKIFILSLLIFTQSGCAVFMAGSGRTVQSGFEDNTPRKTVEKDWGKPVAQTSLLNGYVQVETYDVKYKEPNKTRGFLWFLCDLFSFGVCEIIGTSLELTVFYKSFTQNVAYIDNLVSNTQASYLYLATQLFSNINQSNKIKLVVIPLNTNSHPAETEHMRVNLVSTILSFYPMISVLERGMISEILKEHKFNMTVTDIDESIDLGRLIGADYMLLAGCQPKDGYCQTSATLVNIETGVVEKAATAKIIMK